MNLLLLYEPEEKNTAGRLVRFIKRKKYKLTVSPRAVTRDKPESPADLMTLAGPLAASSHIMALLSGSPDLTPWFAFAAGFSLGSGRSLLIFPTAPAPPEFPGEAVIFHDDHDLDRYLAAETEEWERKETFRQAKTALLDMGVPFNEESLERCIREGKREAVSYFLEAGFSPNAQDKAGVPLLNLAARAGNRNIVSLLLKAGASVNFQAEDRGTTALIDSTAGKYTDIMDLLLEAGADVNLKSKDGQSALIIAVGLNDEASTERLLAAGANADEPDSLGASARKYALLFNKPAIVALFNTYAGRA
ncbi:MAG: ankyrin repeat domain-containing protein [Spirochaetaceae bacterium]|jgi:ankyrin repeat protein|nr:ankyrin repeat domain-containing protein [Spirochaetaceae bacterium]